MLHFSFSPHISYMPHYCIFEIQYSMQKTICYHVQSTGSFNKLYKLDQTCRSIMRIVQASSAKAKSFDETIKILGGCEV